MMNPDPTSWSYKPLIIGWKFSSLQRRSQEELSQFPAITWVVKVTGSLYFLGETTRVRSVTYQVSIRSKSRVRLPHSLFKSFYHLLLGQQRFVRFSRFSWSGLLSLRFSSKMLFSIDSLSLWSRFNFPEVIQSPVWFSMSLKLLSTSLSVLP